MTRSDADQPPAPTLDRRAWLRSALPLAAALCSACARGAPEAPEAPGGADWNAGAVAWMSYDAGLAAGAARQQPILLVLYTDWCPHCHNYSHHFHHPEVVRLSHKFVMIRVDRDSEREISEVYDLDGEYVPRTFFLTPSGAVHTDLRSGNPRYRYFLDEHDPGELVALMRRALERAAAPPAGRRTD